MSQAQRIKQPAPRGTTAATAPAAQSGLSGDAPFAAPMPLICAGVAFGVALILFTATRAPTVTLVDSGELIVAARTLGVAHPPGFPLYIMLAHLVAMLPIGSIAARVNFASALFAAGALAIMSLLSIEAVLAIRAPRRPQRGAGRPPDDAAGASQSVILAVIPVATGTLLLTISRTLWSYATVAEVYTLNTLLILVVFWLMLRWRRTQLQAPTKATDRLLYGAALSFGLGLGVHHVTVGLTLPGLAALVYATEGAAFFKSRRLLIAALCAFAGLMVYAYLPLAASYSPVLNWGDPRTLQRLWWHVTGRQFQAYVTFSAHHAGTEAAEFVRLAAREFGPWWFPAGVALAGVGLHGLLRRDRAVFLFLMLVAVADLAYGMSYEIAEDKAAYYLPAFITLAVAAACGAQRLIATARTRRFSAASLVAAAMLFIPAFGGVHNLAYNNRRHDFIAHDYVDNILSTIGPGGLLLTLDWQVCSPMLYVRTIEQRRRDVSLVDINLMRRSWYFDYLQREYPELMASAHEQVDAFLEDLRHWEQDPALFQRDRTLNQRIDTRFNTLILTLISQHLRAAPVYMTQDLALGRDPDSSGLTRSLTATYQLAPQGLVFQLFTDHAFHEPALPQLQTRGLADGTLRFDADDVVRLKVLPVYLSMLYNRGRYLGVHGLYERAIAAFEEALQLDPTFFLAQRAVAESRRTMASH